MTEQNIHPCAVQNAFDRATDFLCRSQLQTGGFLTHVAADESMTTMRVPESSTFATIFVLYALACLRGGAVHQAAGPDVAEREEGATLSGEDGRVLCERAASDPGGGRSPTGDPIRRMKQRAEEFLIREMTHPGIWHYWTSGSGIGIDPDFGVTCCASVSSRTPVPSSAREATARSFCGTETRKASF
jgi:hypothetical protein